MKVLVDSCVWSLALRRNAVDDDPFIHELRELIMEFRVQIIGPIRQELLSGIKSPAQYKKLRDHLRAFPDLALTSADYECAAEFFNTNRKNGVQGSGTDFLICSVSHRYKMPVLTTDGDFKLYRQHVPFQLHVPRSF